MAEMRLGALLNEYRRDKGMSQRDLASIFGISQQALGNIERGATLPRKRTMLRIAETTGYSMAMLDAAKVAQYQWNLREQAGLNAPPEAQSHEPESSFPGSTGMTLLAKLSSALARGGLRPHQVDALNTLVDSFVRDATRCA